jgi:hypothetical protein
VNNARIKETTALTTTPAKAMSAGSDIDTADDVEDGVCAVAPRDAPATNVAAMIATRYFRCRRPIDLQNPRAIMNIAFCQAPTPVGPNSTAAWRNGRRAMVIPLSPKKQGFGRSAGNSAMKLHRLRVRLEGADVGFLAHHFNGCLKYFRSGGG